MKLIQTDKDTLFKPLQTVTGIVERRHTLPILSNVLIERKNEEISFIATDLEIQITTSAKDGNDDQVKRRLGYGSCEKTSGHIARPA